MASSLQLQEGHDLLSRQPLGIRLETAWQLQPADFINLQLGNGHVSVGTLCETSACRCVCVSVRACACVCLCVYHGKRDYRGDRQMTEWKQMRDRELFCSAEVQNN